MANFGTPSLIMLSGRNLQYVTKFEEDAVAETEDATFVWNAGVGLAKEAFTGISTNAITWEGWYTDTANLDDSAIQTLLGASTAQLMAQYGPSQIATVTQYGNPCVIWDGVRTKMNRRIVEQRAMTKYAAEAVADTMPVTGRLLHPMWLESTFPFTTYPANDVNFGASGTGGVACLQVSGLSLGTATSATVALYDSADGTSFTIVSGGSFTNVTAAQTSQVLTISGTIRQYVGVSVTANGGTLSNMTFSVGLKKN